ncbi:MAG: hypothetical protein GXY05_15150 [Clostridiales bacterium]|mgnify:CR=1|nr:hypothetical protein [Clostridiales bacterium]
MKKLTAFLLSMSLFFTGVTLGFLLSPIKKGIYIGNNSGNKGGNNSEKLYGMYK